MCPDRKSRPLTCLMECCRAVARGKNQGEEGCSRTLTRTLADSRDG